MGLFGGRERPVEVAACGFCGESTTETDRRGKPAHRGCVARVVATVVEEARPSRDSHDLARRLREQEARVVAAAAALVDRRSSR